jgi:hypothetical protein
MQFVGTKDPCISFYRGAAAQGAASPSGALSPRDRAGQTKCSLATTLAARRVREIISIQHKRRKCSAAFVAVLVYRAALIAINPSACYVITNFLEGDSRESGAALLRVGRHDQVKCFGARRGEIGSHSRQTGTQFPTHRSIGRNPGHARCEDVTYSLRLKGVHLCR